MTDAELRHLEQTLETTNGNRREAAAILGITTREIKNRINNNPAIKARWAKDTVNPVAPTIVEKLQTPVAVKVEPIADPVTTTEELELELKGGIEAVCGQLLTADEKEIAKSLHTFQLRHRQAATNIVQGSASVMSIKLSKQTARLVDRLNELMDDGQTAEKFEKGGENETSLVMTAIPKFMAETRELANMVNKNHIAMTELEIKKKEADKPAQERGKPGFTPLVAVNAQPGSTINLGGANGETQ